MGLGFTAAHHTAGRAKRSTSSKAWVLEVREWISYLFRIPRKVRNLEPSLCCSSVTVDVSTVGGAGSADDAMMASLQVFEVDLRLN